MIIKENYLTESNIENWLNICKSYSKNKRRFKIDPTKAALLIIDMQEYFLDKYSHAYIPDSKNILNNINNLITLFRKNNRLIIFTQHFNDTNNLHSMQIRWWKDHLTLDNPLMRITDKLIYNDEPIIQKTNYSAFKNTELKDILNRFNVEQLVITGVMTHLCCDTTARDAFMNDFIVYFMIDSTATYNQQLHLSSITNLSHGFAIPYLCDEYINGFINV